MLAHAQPLFLHLPHVVVLILWVVHLLQLQGSSERQDVLRGPGYAPSQANLTPTHTQTQKTSTPISLWDILPLLAASF